MKPWPDRLVRMEYFGVECKRCQEVFAAEQVSRSDRHVRWPAQSYRQYLNCPHCGSANEYTASDLKLYEREIETRAAVG